MNRLEEINWLLSICSDLKNHYKEHNEGVLTEVITFLKNRAEAEEKTVVARYLSNEKRDS